MKLKDFILIQFLALNQNIFSCFLKYHPPFPIAYSGMDSLTSFPLQPSLPVQATKQYPNFPTTLPCPSSTFMNLTTCLCLPCHDSCDGCSGPTSRDCMKCKFPFKFRDGSFHGLGSCWEGNCGDLTYGTNGKYLDRSGGICKNCLSSAGVKECLGPEKDDAIECESGFQKFKGRCIQDCTGINKFLDRENFFRCENCHSSCQECYGKEISDCKKCDPSSQILMFGRCYTNPGGECSSDQYFNALEEKCKSCDPNCLTCNYYSQNCITCHPSKFIFQNRCFDACPLGTFPNGSECKKGIENCLKFDGSKCTKCQKNMVLKKNSLKCLQKSEGKYFVNMNNKQAECDPICQTSCVNGYKNGCDECTVYKNNGICSSCPPEKYHSHVDKQCRNCHSTCLTCFQSTEFSCLTCPPGKILYNDNSCGDPCPVKTFAESKYSGCNDCHESCLSCKNGNFDSCLTCPSGSILLEGNRCVLGCQAGWFLYNELIGCVRCYSTCQDCKPETGNIKGNCLTCKFNFLEHIVTEKFDQISQKFFDPEKKFCFDEPNCASGYF